MFKKLKLIFNLLVVLGLILAGFYFWRSFQEVKTLKEIIVRLQADSRIAQAIVTDTKFDPKTKKHPTTIKFLEFDSRGNPLAPLYFTFPDNIIQFQSLVIRFDDVYVKKGDGLRGRSAYIFWKVFSLDGANTVEHEITKAKSVPGGYRISVAKNYFEQKLWENFWGYALDSSAAKRVGVKNAQIEAPGTRFIPGLIYTIKIEHNGGIRIESAPTPKILEN